jgi:hypothetical protein
MKNYIVRLHDWNGSIIDGEIYEAPNRDVALIMYKRRCKRLGIKIAHSYSFSVKEYKD